MTKLGEIAKYIRSKNAGPFWVTIDIFFETEEDYQQVVNSSRINADSIAGLYGIPAEHVKIFCLPDLKVIKISFPRQTPQGSPSERDMHSGQQYVPLLDFVLE